MIESVIMMLIYICIIALVFYLVIYVLGVLGVPLPPKVMQILWLIFGLIVVLWLVQVFLGGGVIHLPIAK